MATSLEKDFQYYLDHQDELVKQYEGRFVVIKDGQVLGAYESELKAVEETRKKYELGTFLVQECLPGADNYTEIYHSRVIFA